MGMQPIKRERAMAFLKSHDLPRVEETPHEIIAWCECVNKDGDVFVEREIFRPDIYGLYELNDMRNWLGY